MQVTDTAVGFVGLGLMGTSMTGNLIAAGYQVSGYDTDLARCADLENRGGHGANSIAEVVGGADVVILSLPNGQVVREVCLGDGGVAAQAEPGLIVIDTTTSRPDDSIATAEALAAHDITFLDASVSGTSKMAVSRDLIAMVGGDRDAFDSVGPVLDAFVRARYHLGPSGSGVKAKLIVNHALGITRLMLAEVLVTAEHAGMDLEQMLEVLKDSVAYSKVMDIYGDRMVTGTHQPPTGRIRSHTKDTDLIIEFARGAGVPLWLAPVLADVLRVARLEGMSEWDSTATIEVLRRLTGKGRVPQ